MEFQNYINGRWVKGKSNFPSINPANEEIVADIAQAELSDVDAAVDAAQKAFHAWRLTPAPLRGEMLFKVGDILKHKKEELSQLLTRDMGKVIAEARGDVQEAIDMAYFMGGEGRRMLGYTAPVEMTNKFGMAVRDPAGIVGLITPWNFPIAVPSWKIFPALVAGNTIIWKPSPETPAISAAFVKVFEEAGIPPACSTCSWLPGRGEGARQSPDVRVLSFTGSTTTAAPWNPQANSIKLSLNGRQECHHVRTMPIWIGGGCQSLGGIRHDRSTLHCASRLIVQRDCGHTQEASPNARKAQTR
jgi:aldehyde dehydrogenase (NAD+)